jgi:hypothetical protein
MRRLLLAAALAAALPGTAGATFNDKDIGTAAGQFLKLGPDARSDALAGAVHSSNESASSVYWNPAGLARLRHREVSLSHTAYLQGVYYDFIGYAQPIDSFFGGNRRDRTRIANDFGAIGAALIYLNAGQLEELDNTGTATGGSFTPQDFAFMAGWGLPLGQNLDVGITGKYVSQRIRESATTGAFDLGARYHWRLFEVPYVVSAGIQNMGGRLSFFEDSDPLPMTFYLGNSLRLTKSWTLNFDMVAPKDNRIFPAIGTEYRFVLDPEISSALRVGYQGQTSSADLDGFTGLALGAGVGFSRFTFDYSWSPLGVLGDVHHLSMSYRF